MLHLPIILGARIAAAVSRSRVEAARAAADPALTPAGSADSTWRAGGGDSAPTAEAPFVPAEGRGVLRQTMGGAYDVATIGQFGFSLMRSNFNVQLSVNQMRTPGNVGGLFSLQAVPRRTWVHLEDRQGRSLPVWVLMDGESVEVLVGAGPDRAPILRPTDRGA